MNEVNKDWVLIIGCSSGMGWATTQKFLQEGFNVLGIHFDAGESKKLAKSRFEESGFLEESLFTINANALTERGRNKLRAFCSEHFSEKETFKLVLHSIASGNVKSLTGESSLTQEDFNWTVEAMGTSFATIAQFLITEKLIGQGTRLIGLTSEGSTRAWKGYAAVGAAKAALEACARNMALEYASLGITTNIINAGVTETPALKMIPNHEKIIDKAIERNPFKRLTTPEDVANVVYLLSKEEANWINGTIIRVDGGEQIANS